MGIEYDGSPDALFHPEHRATVFGSVQPPDSIALAIEIARLAYLRADTDSAEHRRLKDDLSKADFGEPSVFNDAETDSQGFGALRDDGLALLAFRGTQSDRVKDVLIDLAVFKKPWPRVGGAVHGGFADAADGLWPQVQPWLADTRAQRRRLLVCGHSLGAAIATLLAIPAGASEVVTIGSPRVGDADFKAAYDHAGIPTTRIVDNEDVVTRVPPSFLPFAYRHVGTGLLIGPDGQPVPDASTSATDGNVSPQHALLALRQWVRRGEVLPRDLTDHAPVNYLRAFWP